MRMLAVTPQPCGSCTPQSISLSSWLEQMWQSWMVGAPWWRGQMTAEPLQHLPSPPDLWVHPGLLAWVKGSQPLGIRCYPAAVGILGGLWPLIAGNCDELGLPAWHWPPGGILWCGLNLIRMDASAAVEWALVARSLIFIRMRERQSV